MIPVENRLDIFVHAQSATALTLLRLALAEAQGKLNYTFMGSGLALHYQNFMIAADPQLVKSLEQKFKDSEDIYVNEYPPEIQAEMDAEQECSLCLGSGYVDDDDCPECHGSGVLG